MPVERVGKVLIKSRISDFLLHFSSCLSPGFKILGIAVALMMLSSLALYGLSVYLEGEVIRIGKETRSIQEDNQDLQITLDRLRSYRKVADSSTKLQGLQMATEIIDVVPKGSPPFHPSKNPVPLPAKVTYGY